MQKFKYYQRADSHEIKNDHCIYRVFKIPGVRECEFYDGTGIVKTYDLTETDSQYPPDEEAVPSLRVVGKGKGSRTVMRKSIDHTTATCPECEVAGIVDPDKKEKFCPDCGLILGRGDEIDSDNLEITPHLMGEPKDSERAYE
jgi:hypothetical protein